MGARCARPPGEKPYYWNRDAIRLERHRHAVHHVRSERGGESVQGRRHRSATLGSEQLEEAMRLRWNLGRYVDGSVFYIDFNFRPGRPTRNYLRRALQLVNDSGELVNKVIALPGYQPAVSLFPAWLRGVNGRFRQEYPPPAVTPNCRRARDTWSSPRRSSAWNAFRHSCC